MTLYEITGEIMELLRMAEECDLDEETVADTLEGIGGEFEDKADAYAKVIRQLEADSAALKAEAKRLDDRRAALDANAARIKAALEKAMRETGKTKFKTALFSFGIQKNAASVVISGDVPEEFLIAQEPKADKAMIKEYLKGHECGWAHLERGESLRIR